MLCWADCCGPRCAEVGRGSQLLRDVMDTRKAAISDGISDGAGVNTVLVLKAERSTPWDGAYS